MADTAQWWAKLSVLLFADTSKGVCRYAEGCSICSKKLSCTYNLMAIYVGAGVLPQHMSYVLTLTAIQFNAMSMQCPGQVCWSPVIMMVVIISIVPHLLSVCCWCQRRTGPAWWRPCPQNGRPSPAAAGRAGTVSLLPGTSSQQLSSWQFLQLPAECRV